MPDLVQVINNAEIVKYLARQNDLASQEPVSYMGDVLFPNVKTDALEIEYIIGGNGLPVSASIHADDTEAQLGSREGWETSMATIALIKRKMEVKESEILKLRNPRNKTEELRLIRDRYNDVDILTKSVKVRVEAMKMELVATGKLDINENGYKASVDYGVPAEQNIVLAGTGALDSPWTAATADPIQQIQSWVDILAGKGIIPKYILTAASNVTAVRNNATVRKLINGDANASKIVTVDTLNDYLSSLKLPTFVTYEAQYNVETRSGGKKVLTPKRFYREDRVTLLPEGPLGYGYWGPTAEESLLTEDPSVDVSKIGNIVASVYREIDPPKFFTKAVARFMPSFEQAANILIAKVR